MVLAISLLVYSVAAFTQYNINFREHVEGQQCLHTEIICLLTVKKFKIRSLAVSNSWLIFYLFIYFAQKDKHEHRCSTKARKYPCSSQIEVFARQNYKKKQNYQQFCAAFKIKPLSDNRSSFQRHSSVCEAVLTSESKPNSLIIGNEKVGVLLLNLGGPETLDDVQPFLFNLFADPVNG